MEVMLLPRSPVLILNYSYLLICRAYSVPRPYLLLNRPTQFNALCLAK